jgi:predicted DNA-binding protein with PD1-like motif
MKKYLFAALFTCILMNTARGQSPTSPMEVYALRLGPGQDLRAELQKFVMENQLEASCILTCVGSLQKTNLRLASQEKHTAFEGNQEIVSLVGTLSVSGSHLHLSVSDSTGRTTGGHLVEGCEVYTTAEIVIGILPGYRFSREPDPASGYHELKVYPKKRSSRKL